MKKFNKVFLSLALVLVLALPMLAGCSFGDLFGGNVDKEVETIELVGTIKKQYLVDDEFESNGAKILVTYTDETTKEVALTKSMTNFNSSTVGKKTLTITYKEKTTTTSYRVDKIKLGVKYTYRYEGNYSDYSLEDEHEVEDFYIQFNNDTALFVANSQLELTWDYNTANNIVLSSIVDNSKITVVVVSTNIVRMYTGSDEDRIVLFRCSE